MERADLPKLKDFAPYALRRPIWYLPLGILLGYIALSFLVSGIVTTFFIHGQSGATGLSLSVTFFAVLWDKSRRLCVNARKRLLKDARQPVLYLRPFFHEKPELLLRQSQGLFVSTYQRKQRLDDLDPLERGGDVALVLKADDTIAKVLNDVGPMVAVGVPKEKLPPAGAIRLFFKDEEWQEKVTALMSLSKLAIIQAGYTQGVEWELNAVRQKFAPEQLYFSCVGWRNLGKDALDIEIEMFRMQMERIYGVSLPERISDAYFISFDGDWRPIKYTLSRWMRILLFLPSLSRRYLPLQFRSTPTPAVRESLRPLLQKRGMRLGKWKTVVYLTTGNLICGLILYTVMASIYELMKIVSS